jgi:hypothetical protein
LNGHAVYFRAIQLCKFSGSVAILLAALACGSDLRAAEDLQTFVTHLMHEKVGAIIVSNPRTGRILAIWNPPGAIKEAYAPGSTAKLVVSAAALERVLRLARREGDAALWRIVEHPTADDLRWFHAEQ